MERERVESILVQVDCYKGIEYIRKNTRRKIKYTTVQKEKHHVNEQESNIRKEC